MNSAEKLRLAALDACRILDTPPEPAFDRLTALAATMFRAPIALISLVDAERQWFKSVVGLDVCSTPRSQAFCAHAIQQPPGTVMVVEDAAEDPRFRDNPLVTGGPRIRFYCGALISDAQGQNLGTLCVIDTEPRSRPAPELLQQLTLLAGVVMDETARSRSARLVSEQGHLLALAEAVSGMGHWRFDLRSREVAWSDEVYRTHGVTREDFTPTAESASIFYDEADAAELVRLMGEAVSERGGFVFEGPIRRPDGEQRQVLSKGICDLDADGRRTALVGVFQDVTEQRRMLRAARESEARYRLLADNATDTISRTSLGGRLLYTSPAIEKLSGYSPEELLGHKSLEYVHPDDHAPLTEAFMALARGERPTGDPVEYRIHRKDGAWIWAEAKPTLLRDEQGRPLEFIDVIRDITAHKQMEADLRQARAEAEAASTAKAEFLANMSHELRTPLTSVIGFSRLLEMRPDLPPEIARYANRIAAGSAALMAILNDLLDFSRLEAGHVEIVAAPTDTHELLQGVLDMFAPQADAKGLARLYSPAADLPPNLVLDQGRLRQVLLNLVGNAVKFTDQGQVELTARWADGRLRCEVRDTGAGLDRDQCAKLFRRFSQVDGSLARSHGGTGLGLAICKGLVEAMDGAIGVEGRPGAGSTFWFEVAAPAVVESAAEPAPETWPARLLVIDDVAPNRDLVRQMVEPLGVTVTEAASGAEGVRLAGLGAFDVILMDLQMPGMDGRTAARLIREAEGPNRQCPIVAFSAALGPVRAAELVGEGFSLVLSKPVEIEALKAVLRAARDQSDARLSRAA